MITDKEKQSNAISKQSIAILAGYWKIPISTVFNFLEHYNLRYSWNSIRTAYYRGKWQKIKKPTIKKALEKKLLNELLTIKKMYPKKKVSNPKKLVIQGEYAKSINAVFEEKQ